MIFEKNKIEKEIFSEYKEKIIDFEFQYNPTTEEVIRNVSDKLKIFKDDKYLIRLLASKKIRNIRIIKKIIGISLLPWRWGWRCLYCLWAWCSLYTLTWIHPVLQG